MYLSCIFDPATEFGCLDAILVMIREHLFDVNKTGMTGLF